MGDNSKLNSAIYFCGENITPQRLKNMTIRNTDQKMTLKCQRRRKWIKHLDANTHGTTVTSKQSRKIEKWCETYKYTQQELYKHMFL